MAGKGIGALFKKLFMSLASSAIGTGTVLGMHSAMAPEEPTFQSSDLTGAKVDESRNMLKVNMDGLSSYFAITLMALMVLVILVIIATCCDTRPQNWPRGDRRKNGRKRLEA